MFLCLFLCHGFHTHTTAARLLHEVLGEWAIIWLISGIQIIQIRRICHCAFWHLILTSLCGILSEILSGIVFVSSWRLHAGGETARLAMSLAIWRGEEETRRRKEEHKLKLNLKTLTCQVGKDGTNMDLWIAEKCWIVGTLVSNPHRITCLYIADESNRYWKDEFVKKNAEVVDQSHTSTNRWFQIVDSTPRHFRIAMSSANFRQACCTNRTGSCQG